jgi:hypothetical protein
MGGARACYSLLMSPGARRAKYWRALQLDGVTYVWKASLGRDRSHSAVHVAVRVAGSAVRGDARRTDAGRGATLLVSTGIGGPRACNGPQCPQLSPPQRVGPRHVAEMVRQARALGWPADTSTANTPFHCYLQSSVFTSEGCVQLVR